MYHLRTVTPTRPARQDPLRPDRRIPRALALLPTIIDLAGVTLVAWLELTGIMLVILAAIDMAYIMLAARARLLLRSPRLLRIANRTSAAVLGGAAAAITAQ